MAWPYITHNTASVVLVSTVTETAQTTISAAEEITDARVLSRRLSHRRRRKRTGELANSDKNLSCGTLPRRLAH